MDEWNDIVYYYNSGKNENDIEIRGNMYPSYMVSDDKEVVPNIVKDFLKPPEQGNTAHCKRRRGTGNAV